MTNTRDNSTPLGDLFGGDVIPPARGAVSDRARKRRYVPKTYGETEVNAARRIISHWNQQFAGVSGAFRANDEPCNIKAYVKLIRSAGRESADMENPFSYIDEAVVRQAITLYRTDPANMRISRWKRFSAWLTGESIDFYKSKIKIEGHAKLQVAQVRVKAVDRAETVRKIATHRLVEIATWAAQNRRTALAFLRIPPPAATASPEVLEEREQWLVIAERRESLSSAQREDLSKRARTVFGEHFNRAIGSKPEDVAIVDGIELALIALYPNDKRLREGAA